MKPLIKHTGIVAPMNRANVDTDAMMPKQYLKCIFKTGYGDWTFDDWRYLDAGDVETDVNSRRKNPDFELNKIEYKNASILLSRENFGCGSSREHAVWGLRDMGFQIIIASSFADIFYNNCFNNGLLAITLTEQKIEELFTLSEQYSGFSLSIDLTTKKIELPDNSQISFELDEGRRFKLMNGLDSIAMTLQKSAHIKNFEVQHKNKHPFYF